MQDTFNVRVDRAFGSLSSSSSSKPQPLSSLWCLTDEEVEKREWNRDRGSPDPEDVPAPFQLTGKKPLDFRAQLEEDIDDLDDEEEARERTRASGKPDDYNDEEWDIRTSIGMDCTLDNEEEEDEYDKVAVGKEKGGDRLYMRDLNDYFVDTDSLHVLPTSFKEAAKDPRANHMAAKIRLKEDAEAAKKIHSLRVPGDDATASMDAQVNMSGYGNLKSILKRKDTESDLKSRKRVRFDSECKDDSRENSETMKDVISEACSMEEVAGSKGTSNLPQDYPSGVPDYMRNPSKYTRYTFDSASDIDDASNKQAYMDFLRLIKKSDTMEVNDALKELPKSVTFVPRRKTGDASKAGSCSETGMPKRGLTVGIAAGDDEDDGVCAMEEDDPETVNGKRSSSHRGGRQYRIKPGVELDESSV